MSPVEEDRLRTLAKQMLSDYDVHDPGTLFADGLNLDLHDAWRLQGAVAKLREARGEDIVGYKIGCVCEVNQRRNGLSHPVWGRLWSTEHHVNGAALSKDNFANLAIEAEFAVSLVSDIDPHSTSIETITEAVGEIYPVIELHNLVWRGEPPRGAELIANNCIHAGVVRGPTVMSSTESLNTDLALIFDGQTVDSWSDLRWPNDILSSLEWLAKQLGEEGKQMKAGDLILTGAFGPPIPLEGASRVEVGSSAFGTVSATFD